MKFLIIVVICFFVVFVKFMWIKCCNFVIVFLFSNILLEWNILLSVFSVFGLMIILLYWLILIVFNLFWMFWILKVMFSWGWFFVILFIFFWFVRFFLKGFYCYILFMVLLLLDSFLLFCCVMLFKMIVFLLVWLAVLFLGIN